MEKRFLPDLQKEAQWFECICIKDIPAQPEKMKGGSLKGQKGFIAVLSDGRVSFWQGKGFDRLFENVNEAKQYFTCIKKCSNKAIEIRDSFNSIMF